MPDRRGVTLLEDLPEAIIDRILIRLPPEDVGRCRAVSTSWRTATSTPEFMLEHHRRQPSLPIIDGCGWPASLVVFRGAGAGASNQQLWPFIRGVEHRFQDWLRVASDGFLILRQESSDGFLFLPQDSEFYICNPVIRKHALLPEPQVGGAFHNTIIGLYRHHPTGEYRVLWISCSLHLPKSSLYVLTVGSDKPRHVRVRMPIVSSPSVKCKLLLGLRYSLDCPPPVHHRGSLHWCPYGANDITGGSGDIIVFDTEAESFWWMRSPAQPCPNRRLFNMKGMLAFWGSFQSQTSWGSSTPTFTAMDIWVTQDYEAEIWALKYRIDLSTVEASRQLYLTSFKRKKKTPLHSTVEWFNDMAVLNEHELLIMFNDEHVLRCDLDGKFLGMVNIGKSQYRMLLTRHRLQENIIPIQSHEMQEEDEEPPFSTGHL